MGDKKTVGVFRDTVQPVLLAVMFVVLLAGCDAQNQQAKPAQSESQRDANVRAATTAAAAQPAATANMAESVEQQNRDAHPGKALHDANCISCHDSGKYQSAARRVTDFPALLAQVRRCDANLNPRLTDDELVQITDYLNQAFYRYDKP